VGAGYELGEGRTNLDQLAAVCKSSVILVLELQAWDRTHLGENVVRENEYLSAMMEMRGSLRKIVGEHKVWKLKLASLEIGVVIRKVVEAVVRKLQPGTAKLRVDGLEPQPGKRAWTSMGIRRSCWFAGLLRFLWDLAGSGYELLHSEPNRIGNLVSGESTKMLQ
jgi:hypothetical protein